MSSVGRRLAEREKEKMVGVGKGGSTDKVSYQWVKFGRVVG